LSPFQRAYVVTLTIPDNEAYTALTALGRLGVAASRVQRADVWLATLDDGAAVESVDAAMASNEAVYNPNKHRLDVRSDIAPRPGEVWITAGDETPTIHLGGRTVAGLRSIVRRTSWRLLDEHGADVPATVLDRATETFLCNPAFQRAIR
jgi:hypothetical protein